MPTIVDLTIPRVRATKENAHAAGIELPSVVTVYRGDLETEEVVVGEPIATFVVTDGGEALMQVVGQTIIGFAADMVVSYSEGFGAWSDINPDSGMTWEEGDLQFLLESEPDRFNELVYRALFVNVVQRPDGGGRDESYLAVLPYAITEGEIVWLTDSDEVVGYPIDGPPEHDLVGHGFDQLFQDTSITDDMRKLLYDESCPIPKEVVDRLDADYGIQLIIDYMVLAEFMTMNKDVVLRGGLIYEKGSELGVKFNKLVTAETEILEMLTASKATISGPYLIDGETGLTGPTKEEDK